MPRAQKSKLEALIEIVMDMDPRQATDALAILHIVNRKRTGSPAPSRPIASPLPAPGHSAAQPKVRRKRRTREEIAAMSEPEPLPEGGGDVAEPAEEVIS